jgi:metal-responsive CopG/Arc/MetJ family transcriptional regulator
MMKAISFTLPIQLLEQVDAIAKALGCSRAELMRSSLTRDLQSQDKNFTEVQEQYSRYQEWLRANIKDNMTTPTL